MDIDYIKKRASEGESDTLEFKKSTAQLKAACETLCAFLNGSGGLVLIGVTDNKKIIGQAVADKTKREIGQAIARISPAAPIASHYLQIDHEKYIIALEAHADSIHKPYTYEDRAYVRVESNTIPMSRDHYHHFVSVYAGKNHSRWEDRIVEGATYEDLDPQEVMETIRIGVTNGRIPQSAAPIDSMEKALNHLNLMQDGQLTNAAVILFGRNPVKWFPQCLLKLASFRGTDRMADFSDNRQFSGNIFRTIDEALIFANRYLPIASYFPSRSIARKDIPLFPQNALREVFANAVCHRDYTPPGSSISVAIYSNRLEVWNCGALPHGISSQNIKTLNKSIPRNPKIAKVLYYRQVVESWGRGIELILNECVKAGHPEPFFAQDPIGITVTLPSKQLLGAYANPATDPQHTELSARQREILLFVKTAEEAALPQIKQALTHPPAERTLQDDLAKLKQLGLIKPIGYGRGAKWILSQQLVQNDAE